MMIDPPGQSDDSILYSTLGENVLQIREHLGVSLFFFWQIFLFPLVYLSTVSFAVI